MEIVADRTEYEILSILERRNRPVTAPQIEEELQKIGIEISRRRIIQYLEELDEKGFSMNCGRDGRQITDSGREEQSKALVRTKLDSVVNDTVRLSSEMRFDIEKQKGNVIANLTVVDAKSESEVSKTLKDVCSKLNIGMPFIKKAHEGDLLFDYKIPEGKMGLATISPVVLDGLFVNYKLWTFIKYNGLVEFTDSKPIRFVYLASSYGNSFDPYEEFLQRKMTSVYEIVKTGHGLVPTDFREYPQVVSKTVKSLLEKAKDVFGGLYILGKPKTYPLGVALTEGYGSISTFGGDYMIFALAEAGIPIYKNDLLRGVLDFKEFEQIYDTDGEIIEA